MRKFISIYLSGLYVKLRGRSITETEMTDSTYSYTHVYTNSDGKKETVLLYCQQFKHTVNFTNPLWPNQVYYTYKVQVMLIRNAESHHSLPIAYYPQLCSKWLSNTTFPHACAINAYIDDVLGPEDEE